MKLKYHNEKEGQAIATSRLISKQLQTATKRATPPTQLGAQNQLERELIKQKKQN